MRILKNHPLLKLANAYVIDASQPSTISYLWNFGSLLAVCLIIQIITGVTLAMHYSPNILEAFNSIEHIMRDVNNGWLIRYLHSNTASAFFFLVYLHIGRGIYYGSYRAPRTLVWVLGTIIFICMIGTGFLGYVLPYGQMSLWGATVITNLISAIPWIGQDIVEFIWGGFSVNNATLNRFFALHYLLPFILAALVLMHLIALHDTAGSSNPLGVLGTYDRVSFAPYYLFKDLITIFIFIFGLSLFVFFMPNVLGDSDNYIMANPMQTPSAIVPEWYLLPFYAILRSIPNKLLGVVAMFAAILIILILPISDLGRTKGFQFRSLSKLAFWVLVIDFLILDILGAKHVETPFIELGQICTILYFSYFIAIVPSVALIENTLIDLTKPESTLSSKKSSINSIGKRYFSISAILNGQRKVRRIDKTGNRFRMPSINLEHLFTKRDGKQYFVDKNDGSLTRIYWHKRDDNGQIVPWIRNLNAQKKVPYDNPNYEPPKKLIPNWVPISNIDDIETSSTDTTIQDHWDKYDKEKANEAESSKSRNNNQSLENVNRIRSWINNTKGGPSNNTGSSSGNNAGGSNATTGSNNFNKILNILDLSNIIKLSLSLSLFYLMYKNKYVLYILYSYIFSNLALFF